MPSRRCWLRYIPRLSPQMAVRAAACLPLRTFAARKNLASRLRRQAIEGGGCAALFRCLAGGCLGGLGRTVYRPGRVMLPVSAFLVMGLCTEWIPVSGVRAGCRAAHGVGTPSPPCGRPSHDATTRLQRPQAAPLRNNRVAGRSVHALRSPQRSLSRPLCRVDPYSIGRVALAAVSLPAATDNSTTPRLNGKG